MSKFKVGDRVKCVDNKEYGDSLTLGAIYTVEMASDAFVWIIDDKDHRFSYYDSRFELAESEKEPEPAKPEDSPFKADYASIEESVRTKIDRSTLIYNYLDTKRDFAAAMTAYNEACQAIRDNLKDGDKFVYTRYAEGYIVQRDKDGFTVERIDMV